MTMDAKLVVVVLVGLALLSCGSAMALSPRGIQLGDCVWYDANRDGKFTNPDGTAQAGEYGINGVKVVLTYVDATGTPVKVETETGTSPYPTSQPFREGWYNFGSLAAGKEYTVTVIPPDGYLQTYDLVGSQTDNTATVTPAKTRTDVDFGYVLPPAPPVYELGDRVWHDFNYNGVQDAGEEGINGAIVTLLDEAGNVVKSATTSTVNGIDGYYLFTGLVAGKYMVEVSGTPVGWACTYDLDADTDSNSGIFSLTANRYDVDFGYVEVPDTGFCTFTQGGWSANPGAILSANWAAVFGDNGLTVGGRYAIHFSDWSDVTNFLPQGGTAAALTTSYTNPTKKISVLAGQVVALRLSLDFSNAGILQWGLGSLVIQEGAYAGQTVGQFLLTAESALGGAPGYDLVAINNTATKINESFDNGTVDTGFIQ